ncbi:hypothetical protein BCV53_07585 [Parageobacillus thermoglucosidasius]|uniref:Uncharacterized protein n=1 Tax=Parageobacillus thermoglucosidasius TaxID=1426 RepID=A0AAN1D6G2_PARTM|nr:hypothetical protein BCV53_07585 [Parageobacillus thermoglucosidasius]APM80693.1 hypothetical protein BCV54_07590 [Parageobacillus thermoglucosidasius]RDE21279.1 hypothetical protein DV712_14170 [Parageobacillus thermoglucosidasius]
MSKKHRPFLPVKINKVCAKKAVSAYLFVYVASRNVSAAMHIATEKADDGKTKHRHIAWPYAALRQRATSGGWRFPPPYAMHKRITPGTIQKNFFKKYLTKIRLIHIIKNVFNST